jgi:phosphotransferase system HPr (HPr) family protein
MPLPQREDRMARDSFKLIDPSELKAIMDHKWYLSQQAQKEVTLEEAMNDFRERYRSGWLRSKLADENKEQVEEISKYKWCRSEEEGHDIGKAQAALEWVQRFADLWRRRKEALEAHGFLQMRLVVDKREGLSIRPASRLSDMARRFDCDVYLHMDGLEYYNFVLNGKEYLSVKSIICSHALAIRNGDSIEFIAMGAQAREALEALKLFLLL